MDKRLKIAAKKLSDAYRAWVTAGAEYNTLVHEMTGFTDNSYKITYNEVKSPRGK